MFEPYLNHIQQIHNQSEIYIPEEPKKIRYASFNI